MSSDALDIIGTEGLGKGNTLKALYQQPDVAALQRCYHLDLGALGSFSRTARNQIIFCHL